MRPSTLPQPVTTPSAAASLPSIALAEKCGRPWMPISTNVPSSMSRSRRSRAVSLPRSCCLAIFSGPPPSFAFSRRCVELVGRAPCRSAACVASVAHLPFHSGSRFSKNAMTPSIASSVAELDRELRAQVVEGVVERHVHLAPHRVLAELHHHGRLRGQLLGPFGHRGVELLGRDDLVDDPGLARLLGASSARPAAASRRLLARDVAVDQRHDHEREEADVDLGRAEAGGVLGDDQVARERDAQRAGEDVAVGRDDRRLAELADRLEDLDERLRALVALDQRRVGAERRRGCRRRRRPSRGWR